MKRLAIVRDTVSGSTAEMAGIIGEVLGETFEVAVLPVDGDPSLAGYDAVVVGSPMRFGAFTAPTRRFIRRHRALLAERPIAYFFSLLYAVRIEEEAPPGVTPHLDPGLSVKDLARRRATVMDRTHSLGYYERGWRRCAPELRPASVAYFKGRLDLRRLPLLARLFMRVVTALTVKEQEGEFLNRATVKEWALELRRILG